MGQALVCSLRNDNVKAEHRHTWHLPTTSQLTCPLPQSNRGTVPEKEHPPGVRHSASQHGTVSYMICTVCGMIPATATAQKELPFLICTVSNIKVPTLVNPIF